MGPELVQMRPEFILTPSPDGQRSISKTDRRVCQAWRPTVHKVFLPPYSPNLNLIERFWKFLKSTALAGVYFESKAAFIEAVTAFLDEVNNGDYDEQLSTLLVLNFQKLTVS